MSHHGLMDGSISVPKWLGRIDDGSHFLLLFLCQFNIPRCPVLLQSLCLGRAWNGNHTLGSNPGECDLSYRTAFPRSKLFDLVHDSTVLVEVIALKFGSCGPERLASLLARKSIVKFQWEEDSHFRRKSSGAKSSGDL